MATTAVLMCENTPVLEFNFNDVEYNVLNRDLLPHVLRLKIRDMPTDMSGSTQYVVKQMTIIGTSNRDAILEWLGNRTLLLSRKNAKWLYNLIKVSQVQTVENRAKIALMCHAVSVLDNYWVKKKDGSETWETVNIRHNHLNEVVTQVALHGKSLTLQGSLITPEFTTGGAYAKGWRRYPDGKLWLHKLGHDGTSESRIEIMCSDLLDKMNVDHVHYEAAEDEGLFVCACPSMTSDDLSILSGEDFCTYCNIQGIDPDLELKKIDAESINKMAIVDYLISNRDRHGQNWGLYYNAHTTEILKCHPLFDHNNAFDIKTMQDKDAVYVFSNKKGESIRDVARYAIKRCDFHFTAPIVRSDFITQRQYDSFMSRAEELGVETIIESDWDKYCKKLSIQNKDSELKRLQSLYKTTNIDVIMERVKRDLM